jgi:poly(3-hydroxybutyrate) depolymerase
MSRELIVFLGALLTCYAFAPSNVSPNAMQPSLSNVAITPGAFVEQRRGDLTATNKNREDYRPPAGFAARKFDFSGTDRTWYGFGPNAGSVSRPTIVLLHGSNRDGRSMLDMWQGVARSENLVLIAPDSTDPSYWDMAHDGEDFLKKLLAEAAQVHAVDMNSVYIFGHSAGANFALYIANSGVGPWRAIGAHAGVLNARKPTASSTPSPVFIYVGDRDHIFELNATRAAARSLATFGHRVSFTVIPNHTHWFYEIGPSIARDAWSAMKSF